jgi:catechol 2,3-dioxygenase-like lactoylglutathione lyase family enzyme
MIGYVTIGTNDLKRSTTFYDAALLPFGYAKTFEDGGWAGYGPGGKMDGFEIYIATPHDKERATFGNGSMLAFKAPSRDAVDEFHVRALKAGGQDEGAPGVRGKTEPPFYGAYVRDPEGNKLCAYFKG